MNELKRSNKITAYWEGDGVAVGVYYKTHDKIATVKSTDDAVIGAGFEMPAGTEENPVTAAQKLEAFKTFLATNATAFGVQYDPVDRRDDAFKFPGSYDAESFAEYAKKMLTMTIEGVLESVQNNVIAKMIKNELLADGSSVAYGVGDANINVTESYSNGKLKYATAEFPVAIAVNGAQANLSATVELVSGQLKKPRNMGDVVITMTGIKNFLVEQGVLPKVEPKAKKSAEEVPAEEVAETPAEV
jgi:predicted deacylase